MGIQIRKQSSSTDSLISPIAPQVANERMALALEWNGQSKFVDEPLRPWKVNDQVAGVTRGSDTLIYATIVGAGHMVRTLPMNFPFIRSDTQIVVGSI